MEHGLYQNEMILASQILLSYDEEKKIRMASAKGE